MERKKLRMVRFKFLVLLTFVFAVAASVLNIYIIIDPQNMFLFSEMCGAILLAIFAWFMFGCVCIDEIRILVLEPNRCKITDICGRVLSQLDFSDEVYIGVCGSIFSKLDRSTYIYLSNGIPTENEIKSAAISIDGSEAVKFSELAIRDANKINPKKLTVYYRNSKLLRVEYSERLLKDITDFYSCTIPEIEMTDYTQKDVE